MARSKAAPADKRMTARLSPADQKALAHLKERYGLRHDIEVIRMALRVWGDPLPSAKDRVLREAMAQQCATATLAGYFLVSQLGKIWTLRGPFNTDAEREHELDMSLIEGAEPILLIDPYPQPHVWTPSPAYIQDRWGYINSLKDDADDKE